MNIRKRTGEVVPFQKEKILNAMKKAFSGQGQEIDDRVLDEMLSVVLKRLPENSGLTVERVQDEVERVLMECGHYEVAKAYILYREKRAALRRVRADLAREVGDDALEDVLRQIQKDFEEEVYPLSALQLKFESFCKPAMTTDAKMEALTKAAVELTTVEAPKWEFIAARLLNHTFSKRNASRWTERGVKGLYEKLRYLTDKGLYGDYILARYSREEIDTAEGFLCPERDTLFTYSGLDLLLKRYVIQSRSREPLETPQEMFLGIALHLAMNEASDRMGWVRRFYDMAPIEHISTEVRTENGDTVVVTVTRPGEFVVCNLASLSLGNLPVEDDAYLERTVETAVRALDNVIDLNFYPLEYARLTNHKYRSIGLGVSGYHHMLAKRGIRWESEEHLAFADAVFERINYAAIRADTALAREKGCYAMFEGSDWQTGAYFEKRGYTSDKWRVLAETVAAQGMRNAYLLAVAPTSSTSILSGTTAGIDPVMRRFFLEEKKGSILPRVAPELSLDTWWYYKAAHLIDQSWSVRAAGVRQRHIDQAQSMNLYITNDYTMRQVLALYLEAWRSGVKTIYYIRSKSLEVEDCESCAS